MKLRIWASIIIFLSAYSPLSVIFLFQDLDYKTYTLKHPATIYAMLGVSIISCIIVWASVSFLKSTPTPITIKKVSNRSGELVNYSIPYMISFFAMDLDETKTLLSFAFFMLIMYWMTLKTHNIFVNPILACLGYNLYDVVYVKDNNECEGFFLVKGDRLSSDDQCRCVELSEQLYLVTERNPEV
jgi:hypothetical protein